MMEIEWPVTCKGSFEDKPAKLCGIDPADMAAIAAELAKEKIQSTLKKGFGKLFGK